MTRVQLLHTIYPHMGNHTAVKPLVRQLRGQNCEVAVQPVPDGDKGFPLLLPILSSALRSRVRGKMAWYKLSDLMAELQAGSRCFLRTCDVVHYFDGEHTAQYLPRLLEKRRFLRGRTIATFHQPPHLLERLVDPRAAACLDAVVVVSPTQRAFFEDFVPPERVRWIPLGVDTEFFRSRASRRAAGPLRCITVGHWLRDWAAMRALAQLLAQRSAEVELHVVTDRETGLEGLPNVRRYSGLTDAQLLSRYQQSDVVLLPLTGSTANNALVEGLSCGLPVVATRLPSVEAYVPASAALLVHANDPELLAHALDELRDEQLRATMGHAARKRAEQLSWSRIAACYTDAYRGLLN
jgi:glycosyltransferase involved in cell wall biosynthesis